MRNLDDNSVALHTILQWLASGHAQNIETKDCASQNIDDALLTGQQRG